MSCLYGNCRIIRYREELFVGDDSFANFSALSSLVNVVHKLKIIEVKVVSNMCSFTNYIKLSGPLSTNSTSLPCINRTTKSLKTLNGFKR